MHDFSKQNDFVVISLQIILRPAPDVMHSPTSFQLGEIHSGDGREGKQSYDINNVTAASSEDVAHMSEEDSPSYLKVLALEHPKVELHETRATNQHGATTGLFVFRSKLKRYTRYTVLQ